MQSESRGCSRDIVNASKHAGSQAKRNGSVFALLSAYRAVVMVAMMRMQRVTNRAEALGACILGAGAKGMAWVGGPPALQLPLDLHASRDVALCHMQQSHRLQPISRFNSRMRGSPASGI